LVEVPVMIALVNLAFWFKVKYFVKPWFKVVIRNYRLDLNSTKKLQ
jgi:hypothetical protein